MRELCAIMCQSVCVFMCEKVCMCHKTASHRSIDATCVCVCVPGWETVCASACLCVCVSVCVKESEGVCLFVCRHTHTWRRTSRISSRVPLNHLGSVSTEIPAQPACAYLSPCSPARIFGAISDECCTQRQTQTQAQTQVQIQFRLVYTITCIYTLRHEGGNTISSLT